MKGIHHVAAIAGKPARNLAFYTRALGLRLLKKTVNFDDPDTYSLLLRRRDQQPRHDLDFLPVAARGAWSGRSWCGQTTAFRVPQTTLAAWAQRLSDASVKHATPSRCFGQPVLAFTDPDGVHLALVGIAGAEREPIWSGGAIPKDEAIWGFHGVTLLLEAAAPTAAVLAGVPGFAESRA